MELKNNLSINDDLQNKLLENHLLLTDNEIIR
jgi:hypothetical protein